MAEGILNVSADQLELCGVRRVCSVRTPAAKKHEINTWPNAFFHIVRTLLVFKSSDAYINLLL
jgi:hypothetical protein